MVTLLVYASRDLCSSGNSAGSDEQQGAPCSAGRISIKIQVSARRSGATSVLALRNKAREQALCEAHTLGRRKPSLRTQRRLRLGAKVGFEPAIRMKPLSSDHESLAGLSKALSPESVSDRDEDEVSSTRRALVCSASIRVIPSPQQRPTMRLQEQNRPGSKSQAEAFCLKLWQRLSVRYAKIALCI